MSKLQRYPEKFRIEAVKQVTERHHSVVDVATWLGVSTHSLYQWIKRYATQEAECQADASPAAEIRRLKAELRRVTDEEIGNVGIGPVLCCP